MRAVLAAAATLAMTAPALADPGWYALDGPLGTAASNDENITLAVWCGIKDAPPLEVEYADFNDDVGGIDRDIAAGTLVVAAGAAEAQRFKAKYEDDNTDFLLTGADAAKVVSMALEGKGLTIYVDIKGKRYSRGVFDNTGMDKAAAPLMACLAQSEGTL